MGQKKPIASTPRLKRVLHSLCADGPLSPKRLSACQELTDNDLQQISCNTGAGSANLRKSASKALQLRRAGHSVTASPALTRRDANMPDLRAGDALVQPINDDYVLVLGNVELGRQYGTHIADVSPQVAERALDAVGTMFAASNTALQVASGAQALQQAGALFQVTSATRPLLQFPQYGSAAGLLGQVRPGTSGIAHLRFERAGTGLRALTSVSALAFTAAVVAGQARTDRTLRAICTVLDDVKEHMRDEQISEVLVASQKVAKVLAAAEEAAELTPGLLAQLPDRERLEVNLDRAGREVQRLHSRLTKGLPSKAGDRLRVLESTTPDIMLALGIYAESERALSAVETLHRHALHEAGDAAAPVLERLESDARATRLALGDELAAGLDRALAGIHADPGGGWFSGGKREKVRALTRQVRSDLDTLKAPAVTRAAVPA